MDNQSTDLESEVLLANFRLTEDFNNGRQSKRTQNSYAMQENISALDDQGTKSKTNVAAMILISLASIIICAIAITFKITFNLDYLRFNTASNHKPNILSLFDTFPVTLSLMEISQLMFAAQFLHFIWSFIAWKVFQYRSPTNHFIWYGNTSSSIIKLWIHASLFWLLIFSIFTAIQYMSNIGVFSVILFTSPLITMLIAYLYLKERTGYHSNKWLFISLSITVIGLLLICQPNISETLNFSFFTYIAMLVVGLFCWSSICILLKNSMIEVRQGSIHWLQFEIVLSLLSSVLWLICICVQYILVVYSADADTFAFVSVIFAYDWQLLLLSVVLMSFFMFAGIMCGVIGFQIGDVIKISCMQYSVFGLCLVFAVYEQFMVSVSDGKFSFRLFYSLVPMHVLVQVLGVGCLMIAGGMQVVMEYCLYLRKRKQARVIEDKYSGIGDWEFVGDYGSGRSEMHDGRYLGNSRQVLHDRMTIF